MALARLSRGEEALPEAEAALAGLSKIAGRDIEERGQALEARAAALASLGRRDDAIASQLEAVAVYAKIQGDAHESTVHARKRLDEYRAGRR